MRVPGEQLKLYKPPPTAAPAELRDGNLSVSIQRAHKLTLKANRAFRH